MRAFPDPHISCAFPNSELRNREKTGRLRLRALRLSAFPGWVWLSGRVPHSYDLWRNRAATTAGLFATALQHTTAAQADFGNRTIVVTLTDGRAKRYEVALPVRYRLAGSEACYAGSTENMSVSGLLFSTSVALSVGSSVEVWVQMSGRNQASNRSTLYCRCSVVRQTWSSDRRPAAAVRIVRSRLLPSIPDFTIEPGQMREEQI